MQDDRPTPEEMLERVAAEQPRAARGRLKIFFGMAPGVGKTFGMLQAAQERRAAGVDVVVGWIETHGRRETAALAESLERIAPRTLEHRGIPLQEFDLDAALARHPTLILVDELAHTNAPGSRHTRRYQDVEELLDAGIDVYTTLNVQHVESLNDHVAIVTGIAVRETVPDSIVDHADGIEFVDLSPDELLQRLREGKVYVPREAERAIDNFFRKRNLMALRQLALRRVADHVSLQAAEHPQRARAGTPLPGRERVLVAVGAAPQSANVVRAAYRIAARLHAPWLAVSVETPAHDRLPAVDRARVAEHLALAEQLGAETLIVRGERVADEILAVARERGATHVVAGRPSSLRWRDRLRAPLANDLVRRAEGVEVIVTAGEEAPERRSRRTMSVPGAHPREYAHALVVVFLATTLCWFTRSIFTLADQAMLYLLGVLVAASRLSRGPALLTAVASVAALDFFFVPPMYTFDVADLRYVITFGVMLVVAITVSSFALRIRRQAEEARQRERRTAALYTMSRDFAAEISAVEIAGTIARQVDELLGARAAVLVSGPEGGVVPLAPATPPVAVSERDQGVVQWVLAHARPAGRGTETLPAAGVLCLPLAASDRVLGVLAVDLEPRAEDLTAGQWQLLETYAAQAALALERAMLAEEAARARIAAEAERARSSLLSLVSHDLRTPLASITGAASVLLQEHEGLTTSQRVLVETVRGESERLCRLVSDLLDLTRLESGVGRVRKEWVPFEEILGSALERADPVLAGRRVETELPDDVLLVPADALLLEHVLVNLIENAAKFGSAEAPIEVRAMPAGPAVVVEVGDRGPGIAAGEQERIFEPFYRSADGRGTTGSGLGLAVCQAIVRAHGGTIRAENRVGGGAVFRIQLPLEGAPPSVEPAPITEEPEG